VIAITIAINNCIQLFRWSEGPLHANNLFSLCLILPFLGVCAASHAHWGRRRRVLA